MVGAITTLIVIVAVFLAYNANNGLPFVPVYRVSVEVPNAARLVNNNEVRIGGHRVGVVESIEAIAADRGRGSDPPSEGEATDEERFGGDDPDEVVARLNLKLDKTAEPIPRTRSSGSATAPRSASSTSRSRAATPRARRPRATSSTTRRTSSAQTEFDDINNTFDSETRENSRTNLVGLRRRASPAAAPRSTSRSRSSTRSSAT